MDYVFDETEYDLRYAGPELIDEESIDRLNLEMDQSLYLSYYEMYALSYLMYDDEYSEFPA